MRKKTLLLLYMILLFAVSNSSAQYTKVLCIDPGHGGPGGGKYGCNGDGEGASGPNGLTEEWVNLQVSLKLRELAVCYWSYLPVVIMTRELDTVGVERDERAEFANFANGARPWDGLDGVRDFISVHHNGLEPPAQGTETFWCDETYTDSIWPRDTDRLLAYKPYLRLTDVFQWPPYTPRGCKITCFDVLRLTTMSSVLSEATSIGTAAEESLFANENSGHADSEAVAICEGWASFVEEGGIAIIKNAYSRAGGCGVSGIIGVGDFWSRDTVDSPYERCWREFEQHYLEAFTPQTIGGYEYTFHHWTHLAPDGQQIGDDWYYPEWSIVVGGELDYHRYVAYFSGGPYSAQVISPDGYEIWHVGEQREILWDVSVGADSTSVVDVFIDRDGGSGGYAEQIADDVWASWGGMLWTVTGDYSTHCRIKVVAQDIADNYAEDVSNIDFIISDSGNNDPVIESHIYCKYPLEECGDCVHFGESVTIQVDASDPDGDSIFYDWYVAQGHFAENGQHTITTSQNYVTYVAPAKGKEGGTVPFEDFISVAVTDVRGGQSCTEGHPELYDEPYSCLCGDANGTSVVNTADPVYILNYLYRGDDPPSDPMLRGDANNNCEIDMGDAIRILNWLFLEGDCPECCWFPPEGQVIVEASR